MHTEVVQVADISETNESMRLWFQAQSARLIGEAIQQNPAFLILRRIEVRLSSGKPLWTHVQVQQDLQLSAPTLE